MTTYSKETALYDTGAIKNGIDEAATTASKYITSVGDTGTWVTPEDAKPDSAGQAVSTTRGVKITDQIDIYRGTESVAQFGESARIGTLSNGNIEVNSDGITGNTTVGPAFGINTSDSSVETNVDFRLNGGTGSVTIDALTSGSPIKIIVNKADYYGPSVVSFSSSFVYGTARTANLTLQTQTSTYLHVEYNGSTGFSFTPYNETDRVFVTAITVRVTKSAPAPTFTFGTRKDESNKGAYSFVTGYENIGSGNYQTVVGKYNQASTDAFVIGNGSSNSARANIFSVGTDGNVTVQNHSSPIGTTHNEYPSSTVSVNSGTATALCSVSLEPGLWLCLCGVRHPQANGGVRRANLRTSSGSTEIDVQEICNANNSVQQQIVRLVRNTGNTNVVYYLNAYQNSGSKLTYVAGDNQYANYICAVRIL